MSRIHPVQTEKVEEKVAEIFTDIQKSFGRIPHLFRIYAHHPSVLEANWNKVKAILLQGTLSRKTKEAIALLVSQDNRCTYCVAAHTMAMKAIGISSEEIDTIQNDVNRADFTANEKALILFARKANQAPNQITDDEFQSLLDLGVSKEEIIEALGVMEIFTSFNKFLDSLDVEVDV